MKKKDVREKNRQETASKKGADKLASDDCKGGVKGTRKGQNGR